MVQSKVTLTSNLDERTGNVAYDRQRATFRCVITTQDSGIHILSWLSEDYIGPGEETLQVTSTQDAGHRVNNSQNPSTVATLVNSSIIDPGTY